MVKPINTSSSLISKINSILSEIRSLNSELSKNISIAKKNKIRRDLNFKKLSLRDYLKKLRDLGKGNIVEIYFECNNKKYVSTYTNISSKDAIEVLKFKAFMKNLEIKILEIKDIPTSINKIIL